MLRVHHTHKCDESASTSRRKIVLPKTWPLAINCTWLYIILQMHVVHTHTHTHAHTPTSTYICTEN